MSLNELPEVVVKVKELALNKKNVKNHPKSQIEGLIKNIEANKVYRHPIIDKDNVVWAGNGLIIALLEIGKGDETLKCYMLPETYTLEQKTALMLADNKLGESKWNEDNLKASLAELDAKGLFTGFSTEEISKLIKKSMEPAPPPAFELTPLLYEKYDYIMIFFSDELDFLFAQQALGLEMRQDRFKSDAVGLCRAIPWRVASSSARAFNLGY